MLSDAEEKLSAILPHVELKPHQREVLIGLAQGQNVFASLPTGYGKSLCYSLPAAAWGWRLWVVSPLISLMEDQVAACKSLGLRATAIHSGMEKDSMETALYGKWEVLFLSPERLGIWWENGTVAKLEERGLKPDLLVLDEMHCFEDWRRFREGYQEVFAPIRRMVGGGTALLGLSASFRESESSAWMNEFCDQHLRVEGALARENLSLLVIPIEGEHWRWLLLTSFLRNLEAPKSALIYCASQKECDEVGQWLASAGFPAATYHAGLPNMVRRERSRAFRAGALRIVCATSAFGMGIDYPWVDRVLHFSLPHDLESYWQEVGRAGRNGHEAYGVAFWRRSELARMRSMDSVQRERFASLWRAWVKGACRKVAVAERLGMKQQPCGKCDRCRSKKGNFLPDWLREWEFLFRGEAWWLESSSRPEKWLEKKISHYGKALDAKPIPDSV
ncbi:MAG: RecQ family ATP-dependent DNA helicase [Bacteriovoracia bacterium]